MLAARKAIEKLAGTIERRAPVGGDGKRFVEVRADWRGGDFVEREQVRIVPAENHEQAERNGGNSEKEEIPGPFFDSGHAGMIIGFERIRGTGVSPIVW